MSIGRIRKDAPRRRRKSSNRFEKQSIIHYANCTLQAKLVQTLGMKAVENIAEAASTVPQAGKYY